MDTHNKVIGYILWIFGFMGSHRFYYGRPVIGTIRAIHESERPPIAGAVGSGAGGAGL